MGPHPRPPSLNLASSSPARPIPTSPVSSHRQSESPFRYIHFAQGSAPDIDEKATPLSDYPFPSSPINLQNVPSSSRSVQHNPPSANQHHSLKLSRQPTLLSNTSRPVPIYARPRGLTAFKVKKWLPIILYCITSLGFLIAIALYKTQVFARLDELSQWLRADPQYGHAILFLLIFITTIPPMPLYSTLIILSGYTFGPWTGAIISYLAALSGAVTVFLIARILFRDSISGWLATTTSMKRVVRAIEKRPKLLFLIRLAPYPYNVMNCLLAAAPTLTFRTYTVCTALSLFKVIIHTSLGSSIHSFKDYHVVPDKDQSSDGSTEQPSDADTVARMWTIIGIGLCIAIFVYLSIVARRAVDDELGDDDECPEETISFLHSRGAVDIESAAVQEMVESPLRTQPHQVVVTH